MSVFTGCSSYKDKNDHIFPNRKARSEYISSYNKSLQQLWDVPYQETDVPTRYGSAHVLMSGPENAPPIILFHGTDASSTMWFPNIKEFSKNHRVYAVDYPLEAGKSMASRKKLDNKQIAVFYNDIFEHFKLDNVSMVAVSRGGWVATFLATQPENRVGKLVLLSPAQTFGGIKKFGRVLSALRLKIFPSRKNSDRFFEQFSYYPERIDETFKEQLYRAYKFGNSKPGLLKMKQFSDEELKGLKIPVLVLIGDHDIVNGTTNLAKAQSLIPNVQTAVLKDAGHFLSIDQSGIVNKMVVDFLTNPFDDEQKIVKGAAVVP